MIHLPTVHICTKFQSRPHSSREKCDQKFQCWKLERKKNEEIKGWISSSSLIPVYMIHLPTAYVCIKFQSSRPHSSWEKSDEKFRSSRYTWYICSLPTYVPSFNLGPIVPKKSDEKFQCWKLEKKKNEEEIKGWISSRSLILVYMIHLPTVHVCTKLQSPRPHSSWEKSDEKFQCWKLERKKNEETKGWFRSSRYTWYICPLSTYVPSFNLLGLTVPEKSVTKNFNVENWRERKMKK